MNILVPQGIGDSVWCLLKIQSLAKNDPVNIHIACWHRNNIEDRALSFLKRFKFVNSVDMYVMPRNNNDGPVLLPGPPADENGIYRYIPDGGTNLPSLDYVMIPNAPLERAIRIENWLPELSINWNIMDEYQFSDKEIEKSNAFYDDNKEFVVFFMASLASNTTSGHNRNGLWSPEEWVELGDKLHEKLGVNIIVTGTTWDEDYYQHSIKNLVKHKKHWKNYISKWEISQTFAIIKKSRFVISYQSGIGIVSHYLGKNLAIFWRPKGDSISPNSYVSFEEGMATAWSNPEYLSKNMLMPCIYGKHKVNDILNHIEQNNW